MSCISTTLQLSEAQTDRNKAAQGRQAKPEIIHHVPRFPDSSGSFPRNLMSGIEHVSTTCTLVIFHLRLLFLILHAGLPLTRITSRTAGGAVASLLLHTENPGQPKPTRHTMNSASLGICHTGKESSSTGVSLL